MIRWLAIKLSATGLDMFDPLLAQETEWDLAAGESMLDEAELELDRQDEEDRQKAIEQRRTRAKIDAELAPPPWEVIGLIGKSDPDLRGVRIWRCADLYLSDCPKSERPRQLVCNHNKALVDLRDGPALKPTRLHPVTLQPHTVFVAGQMMCFWLGLCDKCGTGWWCALRLPGEQENAAPDIHRDPMRRGTWIGHRFVHDRESMGVDR